jgi:hypothetical protein
MWIWILLYLILLLTVLMLDESSSPVVRPLRACAIDLTDGPYDLLFIHHPLSTVACPTEARIRALYPRARAVWVVRDPDVDIYPFVNPSHPRVVVLYADSFDHLCPLDRPVPTYPQLFVQDRPVWIQTRRWCIPITRAVAGRWLFYSSLFPGHRFVDVWSSQLFMSQLPDWIWKRHASVYSSSSPTVSIMPLNVRRIRIHIAESSEVSNSVNDELVIWVVRRVSVSSATIQILAKSPLVISYVNRWIQCCPTQPMDVSVTNHLSGDRVSDSLEVRLRRFAQ